MSIASSCTRNESAESDNHNAIKNSGLLVPAAQYVRASTERQQYSIDYQSRIISQYASGHGFEVVRTFSDEARSGLDLRYRPALRQLLAEVMGGQAPFRLILVFDVSRWGRFQDTDEAAHYEYVCKSAGIPIHYCAEQFSNEGRIGDSLLKTLKRFMAGEFSRDLSARVSGGLNNIVARGFKYGSVPGYGLRRMLVGPDGRYKQLLAPGELKNISSDRVVFVPGPPEERYVAARLVSRNEQRLYSGSPFLRQAGKLVRLSDFYASVIRFRDERASCASIASLPEPTALQLRPRRDWIPRVPTFR